MITEHPMIKNIMSLTDPALWEHSMELADGALAKWMKERAPHIERVIFVGHGSSLANSQVGKYIVEHIAHIPAEASPAFSFAAYTGSNMLGPRTLVVGISTTGRTQSVVDSLERARQAGCPTLAISAHAETPVTQGVEAVVLTGGDGDTLSVKTSSYVLALIPLYMLALRLTGAGDPVRAEWQAQVREAGAGAARFLTDQRAQIQSLAQTFKSASHVFVLGSGPNIGTSEEAALKMIEMAKLYAESQELEEFFHGRLREVDQVNPMFLIAPDGRASGHVLDYLTVMQHIKSPAVVLTDSPTPEIEGLATHIVKIPARLNEFATPLLYILPLHLFAYELALVRGFDPNAKRYEIEMRNVRYGDRL